MAASIIHEDQKMCSIVITFCDNSYQCILHMLIMKGMPKYKHIWAHKNGSSDDNIFFYLDKMFLQQRNKKKREKISSKI